MSRDQPQRDRLRDLPRASDLMSPWQVRNISIYPFGPGWWPFNPSIHRDPETAVWRCMVRCANYTIPQGELWLSSEARAGRVQTRNALLTLDKDTLAPVTVSELLEPLLPPRAPQCGVWGLEDLRLFRTAADGLCAVGCALQYNLEHVGRPEMVLVRIEESSAEDSQARPGTATRDATWVPAQPTYTRAVEPLRGPWGFRPQKNWVPFDGTEHVRLLYSIERGVVMAEQGPAPGSPDPLPAKSAPVAAIANPTKGRNGAEVRVLRKTPGNPAARPTRSNDATHAELRGGSQLVALPDGRWLGVGHEMTFSRAGQVKFYWHTWYTVDHHGQILERSQPFRLSGFHGIEFAAGLAIDHQGRVAVSYGTDDHEAWIATTTLPAVLRLLRCTHRSHVSGTAKESHEPG